MGGKATASLKQSPSNAGSNAGAMGQQSESESESQEATTTAEGYPADFELLWKAYPKKIGPNNKRAAFKAYTARLNQGVSYDAMFDGVKRYRAYLHASGKEGTEFVKMASTFLGPDRHFAEAWESPVPKPSSLDLREAMMRKRGYV
jgi:hypothetical protein